MGRFFIAVNFLNLEKKSKTGNVSNSPKMQKHDYDVITFWHKASILLNTLNYLFYENKFTQIKDPSDRLHFDGYLFEQGSKHSFKFIFQFRKHQLELQR